MSAPHRPTVQARRPASARSRTRFISLVVSVGVALLGVPPSLGGALVTTETVITDNAFDAADYNADYGVFNAEIRPHLGTTFSDGAPGYLRFNLFDGPTVPVPVPAVNAGESIHLRVDLPTSISLDRSRFLRGPATNWCAGLPAELSTLFGAPDCDVTGHPNGASSVVMTLTPSRDLISADFETMNKIGIGFGVQGTTDAADGTDTAFVNLLFPDAHEEGRSKTADVAFATTTQAGSTLGVWEARTINSTWDTPPAENHWRGGDQGVLQLALTGPRPQPVRMRPGESIRLEVKLFESEDARLDVDDTTQWCDSLLPADFAVQCSPLEAPVNGVRVDITRAGASTNDAFPGGLTLQIPIKATATLESDGYTDVSIWTDMTQPGSGNTFATSDAHFLPGFRIPETGPVERLNATGGLSSVFAPDGETAYAAVVAGPVYAVRIIDVASNMQKGSITGLDARLAPGSLAVTNDGRWLYVAYTAGIVAVVDLETNAKVGEVDNYPANAAAQKLTVSPDGKSLYAAVDGGWVGGNAVGGVRVIDVETNTMTNELDLGEQVSEVAFSPDGATMYVGLQTGRDGLIAVVDPESLSITSYVGFNGPLVSTEALKVTSDGSTIYVGTSTRGILEVDTATLAVRAFSGTFPNSPLLVTIAPDETYGLFTSSREDGIFIFDIQKRDIIGKVENFTGKLTLDITFAPDGSKAYVMSVTGTIMSVLTPSGSLNSASGSSDDS